MRVGVLIVNWINVFTKVIQFSCWLPSHSDRDLVLVKGVELTKWLLIIFDQFRILILVNSFTLLRYSDSRISLVSRLKKINICRKYPEEFKVDSDYIHWHTLKKLKSTWLYIHVKSTWLHTNIKSSLSFGM